MVMNMNNEKSFVERHPIAAKALLPAIAVVVIAQTIKPIFWIIMGRIFKIDVSKHIKDE